ncbi:YdcF family protein [Cryptosporangium arvum]|uniref:DUF218 domain-containing protein n=1 Tax=Cryptosporangium arvum DSM 44712 TaxID=927661 RepID=A0A011AGT7_9ACTN|nr:YdcF family protein [Cryptosporangium arvum]EXG81206.1 hypothetical protein CryarDRAFT_2315 [Cryptosporangium arvum DSM 44712]
MQPGVAVNTLVEFCARRDVAELTPDALGPVDVVILFGGSILAGGDVFARAIADRVAGHFVIVGGQGHSTDALRDTCRNVLGWDDVDGRSEAALFDRYLRERHGVEADRLETASTNCGTNVRNALELLAAERVPHRRIVIIQDASMQLRMHACFRLLAPDLEVVNFAAHQARVDEHLRIVNPPLGMWSPERYLTLLMGEVPRLTDDEHGYGPAGRGFIAHVDVPAPVREAHAALLAAGVGESRAADPRWA